MTEVGIVMSTIFPEISIENVSGSIYYHLEEESVYYDDISGKQKELAKLSWG